MTLIGKLLVLAGPLLLLLLTAVAGYAYSQIRFLSLPIPQALGLFTVVLPLITGISTQGAYGLIQRSSKNEQYQLTIPLIAVIGFQLVYETIVATLAMTFILPPSDLGCGLNDRWTVLYRLQNEKAIRAIQDSYDCCGLRNVRDKAYPFNSTGHSFCTEITGRTKSCFDDWKKAEQINAGLFLLVALVVFVLKVLSIISLLTSSSWTHSRWTRPFKHAANEASEDPEEDNRAHMRRLVEEGISAEQYHDESEETPRVTEGEERGATAESSQ